MKVMMQGVTTVLAGTTSPNVLEGEKYSRPPADAYGTVYATASAAGVNGALNVNGFAVTDTVAVSDQNRLPIVPDDMWIDGWTAPQGGLLQLQFTNTDPLNDLDVFWRVELDDGQ